MTPRDIKGIVDKLTKLGFKVVITPGPVDRLSRPMSFELQATSHELTIEERAALAKFLTEQK